MQFMKKRLTKLILLLLVVISANAVYAHEGSFKGIVYNGNSHNPIEGASIYIKELKTSAVTDAFGKFFLKDMPEGSYTVTLSHLGFGQISQLIKVEDGITTDLSFNLL